MKGESKIFGMSRNVILLGFVSLLNDMSSEMIAPVVPTFLRNVLKIGKFESGSIMGLIESLSSLFKVVFGYLSDRFQNRKFFVVFGYLISTISRGFLSVTQSWLDFLTLRIADRAGKGIRTAPRDAIIAESDKVSTGKSFGFHRMMDTVGAVLGPLAAIAILALIGSSESSLRTLFLISAIPGLAGVAIVVIFVRDTGKGLLKEIEKITSLKNKRLKLFLFVVAIGALGRYSYAFTMWRAEELGYTVIQTLGLYTIFNFVYMISAFPAGVYSDRIGKKRVITAGFGVATISSVLFAYAQSITTLIAAFILYGIYLAIEDTIPRAYMADMASEFEKATIIGAYHTVFGFFVFPASLIMGYLWQSFGLYYSFVYAAVMSTVAMLLMVLIKEL
jgi:MFS family permease